MTQMKPALVPETFPRRGLNVVCHHNRREFALPGFTFNFNELTRIEGLVGNFRTHIKINPCGVILDKPVSLGGYPLIEIRDDSRSRTG